MIVASVHRRPRIAVVFWISAVIACIGSPVALADTTLRFFPQQAFASDGAPGEVRTVDINADGKLDLAVGNSNGYSVSVLLNTSVPESATLTFDAQVPFGTGQSPNSLSTADVNDDGREDLIVANYVDDTVSVLLNTTAPGATAPSFASQQIFATGSYPDAVATVDVNGDARPDVIVANYKDNTLSVLINITAPGATASSFAGQKVFVTGTNPYSVATADMNVDGLPDLLTANLYGNSVSVLLNTTVPGTGALRFASQQEFASGTFSETATAADFNADGMPDVVVANYLDDSVSVLLSTALPGATRLSFAPRQIFAAGDHPYAVTAADVSMDGAPDIIAANSLEDTVSVLVNATVAGSMVLAFAEQQRFATGWVPIAIVTADVNGDGDLDLISSNYVSGTVSVLLNATGLEDYVFADGFE